MLSPVEVKNYEFLFSGSVFQYDKLELKEIIGEGLKVVHCILIPPPSTHPVVNLLRHFDTQVLLGKCILAF